MRLSTRQWIILEVLLLANVALFASWGLLAFSHSAFAFYSRASAAPAAGATPTGSPVAHIALTPAAPAPTFTQTVAPAAPPPTAPPPRLAKLKPSRTPTPVLSPTPPPTITATPTPSGQAHITGIVGHTQSLPLSCEARSAADWAGYFGVPIDELEFLSRLPVSDDPEAGFVGDVNGAWGQTPPGDYGVHAGPVAALLRDYGLSAQAAKGLPWETVAAEIAAGRPVIVWVVGHVATTSEPVAYTASDGQTTIVASREHTVMVTGYSPDTVTVLDGSKTYGRSLNDFLASWAVLGNMAVLAAP
ncbi:MAG: C39 family peptidase [Chloroflexi bacterium]|nr:C39 family peptidase [Chloroflexota bacterium]